MAEEHYEPISALRVGLACRCPRCGKGKLFAGFLTVAERCTNCGLELKKHDAGDGPAVFVMFIVGAIVVALALWVELAYEPPYWVHVVIWGPLIIFGSMALLRPAKAILIALQYKHKVLEFGESNE